MHQTWEPATVLLAVLTGALWVCGVVLLFGFPPGEVERLGFLFVIIASTATALAVTRARQMRMSRAFVHGYHAGFHDASKREHHGNVKDCEVLELSEMKARRLSRSG